MGPVKYPLYGQVTVKQHRHIQDGIADIKNRNVLKVKVKVKLQITNNSFCMVRRAIAQSKTGISSQDKIEQ
jgi:hypothetical protein